MKTTADATTGSGTSGKGSATTGPTSLLQLSAPLRCVLAASVVAGLWLVVGWAMQWW